MSASNDKQLQASFVATEFTQSASLLYMRMWNGIPIFMDKTIELTIDNTVVGVLALTVHYSYHYRPGLF